MDVDDDVDGEGAAYPTVMPSAALRPSSGSVGSGGSGGGGGVGVGSGGSGGASGSGSGGASGASGAVGAGGNGSGAGLGVGSASGLVVTRFPSRDNHLMEEDARRMYWLVDNEWTKRIPEPNGNHGNTMRQVFRQQKFTTNDQTTQLLLDKAIAGYLAQSSDAMPLLVWTRLAVRDADPWVFERLYLAVRDLPAFNRDRLEETGGGEAKEAAAGGGEAIRAYVQRGRLWEVDVNGVNLQRTLLDHNILLFDAAYMNRPQIARVLLKHFDYNQVAMDVAFYLSLMGGGVAAAARHTTTGGGGIGIERHPTAAAAAAAATSTSVRQPGSPPPPRRKQPPNDFACAKLFLVNGAEVNAMNHAAMFGAIRRDDTNAMYFLYYFGDRLLLGGRSREAMFYAWEYSSRRAMEFIVSKCYHNRMSNLLWLPVNSNIYREISALNERLLDNIKSQNLESLDLPWTALHVRGVTRFHGRGTNQRRRPAVTATATADHPSQSHHHQHRELTVTAGAVGSGGVDGDMECHRQITSLSSIPVWRRWLARLVRLHHGHGKKKLACVAGTLVLVPAVALAARHAVMRSSPPPPPSSSSRSPPRPSPRQPIQQTRSWADTSFE